MDVQVLDYARLSKSLTPRTLARVHRTDFHQLYVVTKGTASAMVDFVNYSCFPGALIHVAPGRVLRLPRPSDTGVVLEAQIVLFRPAFLPRLDAAHDLLSPFGRAVWTIDGSDERARVAFAIAQMSDEYARAVRESDPTLTTEMLRHLLAALILRIARQQGRPNVEAAGPSGPRNDAYIRFHQELESSFLTTRTASDYAFRLGYSLRTVNRACKDATGFTAKALIDARVALEAKRLLAHTDLPIAAISHRLGFTEPTNFGKFFARETGYPPGTFRTRERP